MIIRYTINMTTDGKVTDGESQINFYVRLVFMLHINSITHVGLHLFSCQQKLAGMNYEIYNCRSNEFFWVMICFSNENSKSKSYPQKFCHSDTKHLGSDVFG